MSKKENPFMRPWIDELVYVKGSRENRTRKSKKKNEGAKDTVKMFLRGRRSSDGGEIMEVKRRAFSEDHRGRHTRVMFVVLSLNNQLVNISDSILQTNMRHQTKNFIASTCWLLAR